MRQKFIRSSTNAAKGLCQWQTDSVRIELGHIFQHIDKTHIPTGYLNEYGPVVVNKKWITGTLSDSNFIYDIDVFNLI